MILALAGRCQDVREAWPITPTPGHEPRPRAPLLDGAKPPWLLDGSPLASQDLLRGRDEVARGVQHLIIERCLQQVPYERNERGVLLLLLSDQKTNDMNMAAQSAVLSRLRSGKASRRFGMNVLSDTRPMRGICNEWLKKMSGAASSSTMAGLQSLPQKLVSHRSTIALFSSVLQAEEDASVGISVRRSTFIAVTEGQPDQQRQPE